MTRWLKPVQLEEQWVQVAQELGMSSKLVVANSSTTMLRGDAHVDNSRTHDNVMFADCLHECLPGPPDTLNWMLYNIFLGLDLSSDPVQRLPLDHAEQQRQAEHIKQLQAKRSAMQQQQEKQVLDAIL